MYKSEVPGEAYARATAFRFVLLEPATTVPFVENMTLSGSIIAGQNAKLHYEYIDRNDDPESGSVYKIMRRTQLMENNGMKSRPVPAREIPTIRF